MRIKATGNIFYGGSSQCNTSVDGQGYGDPCSYSGVLMCSNDTELDSNAFLGPSVAAQTNISCADQSATIKAHPEWPGMSPLSFPAGSKPIIRRTLSATDEEGLLGATVDAIASTIARLEAAFEQSPDAILNDKGIEKDFAFLRAMRIPAGSPLSKAARAWWDPSKRISIGPWDADGSPSSNAEFWDAFGALKNFNEWDQNGTIVSLGNATNLTCDCCEP